MKGFLFLLLVTIGTLANSSFQELLKDIPTVKVPFVDTTNFDNVSDSTVLDAKQIELFHLPEDAQQEYVSVIPNAIVEISSEFIAIHFTFLTEHELETVLITYSKYGDVIDILRGLAVDDIVEGFFYSSAIVYSDKVVIEEINNVDSPPGESTDTIQFLVNGTFQRAVKE